MILEETRSYKIADTIITLDWSKSKVPPDVKNDGFSDGFICKKKIKSDIHVSLEYGYIPRIDKKHLFTSGSDWRLSKSGDKYIYEKPDRTYEGGVSQLAILDRDFKKGVMFLQGKRWGIGNIMTSFLQVLLLNFLAHSQKGLLTHSASLRYDKKTLVFLGKQNAGKSTMAELWSKNTKEIEIFNDDRCVIKRVNGKFKIYSTPWPGSFSRYELAHKKSNLDYAYFIYHSKDNRVEKLQTVAALGKIMQNIFPPFWSEEGMKFILSFCHKFVNEVSCYDLGFLNDENIITFLKERLNKIRKE